MRILVMAKSPEAGRVKTRLCPPCSPEQAAEVAAAAIADTLDAAVASGHPVVLALDGPVTPAIAARPVTIVEQRGTTLAERLEHAWAAMDGGGIQIGMDTPQVSPAVLAAAVDALREAPSVLGLAEDGGWWCIGMRAPRPGVFAGIPTSTAETGARQRDRLSRLGLEPAPLPTLRDVDTWDDALAVAALAPDTAFSAAVGSL